MPERGRAIHVATTRRHYKGRVYETHLLRRSYRAEGRVKTETVGNISHLPAELIDLVRRGLRGERFTSAEGLELRRSTPHGHVVAVLGTLRRLGLETLIERRPSRQRDLVVALVAARLLSPGSKLDTSRRLGQTTLGATLAVADASEDELYGAMDWLLSRQGAIEKRLAARHLEPGGRVLYDLSSTYVTGRHNPLARLGYSRDGKQGTLQIEYGLITDEGGLPVAVEVFPGNTGDPATVATTVDKVQGRFGLASVVLVGDRGMLTSARIETLRSAGLDWISSLRGPAIAGLVEAGDLQLGLFDERNLAEISSPDYPGERLIVCRNPLLAAERARKREDLLAATEAKLAPIAERVAAGRLRGAARIGLAVGKVIDRHKVAKHFRLEIGDDQLSVGRDEAAIVAEAALDGLYVIRTSVAETRLAAPEVVRSYKLLTRVERAFRAFKGSDIAVRPIRHWTEPRVRAHVLLCMLAYYVQWHLERAWAPLLFRDEERPELADPVAPAQRSAAALRKARTGRLPDGTPAHSFRTLLAELANLTRDRLVPAGAPDEAAFEIVASPTPLQARALSLLSLTPASV
ncbi:MAG: IS1634 family transposase [Acidimicrobiales bacterium]